MSEHRREKDVDENEVFGIAMGVGIGLTIGAAIGTRLDAEAKKKD
jgi:uncharacterized membrane protein YfcA